MKIVSTPIDGVVLLESTASVDARGAFVRTFDRADFAAAGLVVDFVEHSLSTNNRRGTVRGLHLQTPPDEEVKVVRCVRGRMWDVVADLRPASPTFRTWHAVELDDTSTAIYVPAGVAHGFQTLADDTAVLYLISVAYAPASASGVRWDDPVLAVEWPESPTVISDRDRSLPTLAP